MIALRPPTEDDLPRLVEISREAQRRLGEESTANEDDMRFEWQQPGFERERHARVAEMGGDVVATAGLGAMRAAEFGKVFGGGHVVQEHRGKGIGTALMDWLVETARAEPGAKVLRSAANMKEPDAIAFLEQRGFEHDRSFYWMLHPNPGSVPPPEWPPGIRVDNSLRGAELARAIVSAHDGSFIDHWNFMPARQDETEFWLRHPEVDPELCFIGWAGDEIAGYSWNFIDGRGDVRKGVVGQLGTTRRYRGIGLGRALLRHGVRELVRRDPTEVGLGVDAENMSGALGLYERTGFEVRQENRVYRLDL